MGTGDQTVVIVDDTPANLRLLAGALLEQGYNVRAFPSGPMALRAMTQDVPDLILLDINMPEMDGFEVCENLKKTDVLREVPVIFISAVHEVGVKVDAFTRGGVDYITKPFQLDEVFARVRTHLELKQVSDVIREHNLGLTRTVAEQVRELWNAQEATIVALARLSHLRDDDTGKHVERMGEFSGILATRLRERLGEEIIDERYPATIIRAAALHDIGKVGIPDAILLKPGKLTADEWTTMKTHTTIGHETLEAVMASNPGNRMIQMGGEIARSHHERWDGSGYPDGLVGDEIPLSARIVAVADVYDALRSRRPYKEPFSHEKATSIVLEGRGGHFDPKVVDAFVACAALLDQTFAELQD